jgi:transmembrane sensor
VSDPVDLDLLDRYLAGRCSASDAARVRHWLEEIPARQHQLDAMRALARSDWEATDTWDVENGWAALHASGNLRVTVPAVGARAVRPQFLIAAMVVVALGVGLTVSSWWRHASVASPSRTYATAAGQRLSVTLVDGTQLTLAPASSVRVAADYGRGTTGREVELEGEAYFGVAHDAAHPFAVRAHGAVVRDVATAFDVRAYLEDAGTRIAVAEGTVTVSVAGGCPAGFRAGEGLATSAACGAHVQAGDVATISNAGVTITHHADVAAFTAWRSGRLAFRDASVGDVVAELNRWYDMDLTLADSSLITQRLTANWTHEPTDRVLTELAALLGARVDQHGRTVTITTTRTGDGR